MPREIVKIEIDGVPSEIAVAKLCSYLAYPDAQDDLRRNGSWIAFYRAALAWRTKLDKEFATTLQSVILFPFIHEQSLFEADLERARDLFARNLLTAFSFLAPHLETLASGKPQSLDRIFPTVPDVQHNKNPTVENMAIVVARLLGMSENSYSNIKSETWAPIKPMAHLGYALACWLHAQTPLEPKGSQLDSFFRSFFDKDTVSKTLALAEQVRVKLPLVKKAFRISEAETVRFVTG